MLSNLVDKGALSSFWLASRRNLVRALLGVFLILLSSTCLLLYTHHKDSIKNALEEDRNTARLVSLILEEHFQGIIGIMQSLGCQPAFARAAWEKNADEMAALLDLLRKELPFIEGAFVTDTEGTPWTRPPLSAAPEGKSLGLREWRTEVRLEWKPYVSTVSADLSGGENRVVIIGVPVFGPGGAANGILAVTMRPNSLGSIIGRVPLHPGISLHISDREGHLVFCNRLAAGWGEGDHPFRLPIEKAKTEKKPSGAVTNPLARGGKSFVSFAAAAGPGLGVFVARDSDAIFVSERTHYAQKAAISGFLFFLTAIALFYVREQGKNRLVQERQKAEMAQREQDLLFKKLSRHVPGVIFQFMKRPDGSYGLPFATEFVKDIFGCSPRDVLEDISPLIRVIWPEDRDNFLDSIRVSAERMTTLECEFRVQVPGRPLRWTVVFATPEKLPDGGIIWHGFNADITERKLSERVLRESEEKYRRIAENIADVVWVTDMDLNITYVSPSIERMTGEPLELQMKRPVKERFSPDSLKRLMAIFEEELENEKDPDRDRDRTRLIEVEHYTADGNAIWIAMNISFVRDEKGNAVGVQGVSRDITDRKKAELALHRAEEKYRSIFENAQEGIFQTTREGRFLTANQSLAAILGYDSPEDLMTSVKDVNAQLYVNPEDLRRMSAMIENGRMVTGYEIRCLRKDGTEIWASLSQRAVLDADGRTLFYEGSINDITGRKTSMEQIRKALSATIRAMAVVVETRDPYTAGHQRRVADLSRAMATEMGLPSERIDGIRMAGIIHDLGKISVPAEILSKPSRLTGVEFMLIKTHPQAGHDILKDIQFPWPIARMVLEHHERTDGSGYPNGLTGDKTLLESRILAVADVVESMASHRPFRPALGVQAALKEIAGHRGTLYDPKAVDACLAVFRKGYAFKA